MSEKTDNAVSCFNEGFSCSQAVFSAFAQDFGVDSEQALKIAGAFGGGIARRGETCGAVTGALMVLGLKYGKFKVEDDKSKEITYNEAHKFFDKFIELNGSLKCKELLGCDISTPKGLEEARQKDLFNKLCPDFVKSAVEILETIIKNNR